MMLLSLLSENDLRIPELDPAAVVKGTKHHASGVFCPGCKKVSPFLQ
jgi:hypothetical protein